MSEALQGVGGLPHSLLDDPFVLHLSLRRMIEGL